VVNTEFTVGPATEAVLESYVLPAMNILGRRAKRMLVLGGGSGSLVRLALKFPTVDKITVVEIDEDLVDIVTDPSDKNKFPSLRKALTDSRVELVTKTPLTSSTKTVMSGVLTSSWSTCQTRSGGHPQRRAAYRDSPPFTIACRCF